MKTSMRPSSTWKLYEFIDRIVVHEAGKMGTRRTQRIEIYYSFIGAVELPEKPDKKDKSA